MGIKERGGWVCSTELTAYISYAYSHISRSVSIYSTPWCNERLYKIHTRPSKHADQLGRATAVVADGDDVAQ